jgi:hypothetical protein
VVRPARGLVHAAAYPAKVREHHLRREAEQVQVRSYYYKLPFPLLLFQIIYIYILFMYVFNVAG